MEYFVEIVKFGPPEEVVKRMGPMSESKADRVETGAANNLNHHDYYVRTVSN